MTLDQYELMVAVALHEMTGWPLHEAEKFIGDVSDFYNEGFLPGEAAYELLGEAPL